MSNPDANTANIFDSDRDTPERRQYALPLNGEDGGDLLQFPNLRDDSPVVEPMVASGDLGKDVINWQKHFASRIAAARQEVQAFVDANHDQPGVRQSSEYAELTQKVDRIKQERDDFLARPEVAELLEDQAKYEQAQVYAAREKNLTFRLNYLLEQGASDLMVLSCPNQHIVDLDQARVHYVQGVGSTEGLAIPDYLYDERRVFIAYKEGDDWKFLHLINPDGGEMADGRPATNGTTRMDIGRVVSEKQPVSKNIDQLGPLMVELANHVSEDTEQQ